MAQNSPQQSQSRPVKIGFGIAFIAMIGVLLLFFSPSFNATNVLFANDGPLGALMAHNLEPPQSMFGVWLDLNWIGAAGGTYVPSLTFFLLWALGPLSFAKFYDPIALLYLGICARLYFRQMRWHPLVCLIASLAMVLNMNIFSNVCWGLGTRATCLGSAFLGLAAFEASKRHKWPWLYLILGGLAIGICVCEGADNGAIYSIVVAAYVAFSTWQESGRTLPASVKAIGQVAVIAIFAGIMAAQAIGYLVPTAVKTVMHANPTEETKLADWNFATQWSLPKKEIIRVLIPGIFGYRMEPGAADYWGTVGQTPGWEQIHQGTPRFSGSGEYAGVIVLLIAAWAVAQSFRRAGSTFSDYERKMVLFVAATAVICVLLAFGRYAPFYRIIYALPYFSTIRNPIKFMQPFQLAVVIIFSFGLQDLFRRALANSAAARNSVTAQLKLWWSKAVGFDRKWVYALIALFAASVVGYMAFSSASREVINYLTSDAAGFRSAIDPRSPLTQAEAREILSFSKAELGLYLLFLAASIGALVLLQSGSLAGRRIKWGAVLILFILVVDMHRADAHWVRYEDYKKKYASNEVFDFLARKPYENRVALKLMPFGGSYLGNTETFMRLMNEWSQHQLLYYNIQSLDVVQMPRFPDFEKAYTDKLRPTSDADLTPAGRLWLLGNTRYIVAMKPYVQLLNERVDPVGQPFRVHTSFDLAPKPGVSEARSFDDITIVPKPEGQYALIEYTRALPRASLFSNWQVSTNDDATLARLADRSFDPNQLVLVAEPVAPPSSAAGTNSAGSVEYTSYAPKDIKLRAKAETPSILLLNDKYDAEWHVYVDGKQGKLLRCNYIMRGVALPVGEHNVEFRYQPALHGLYTTLGGLALAIVLCVVVPFIPERTEEAKPQGARTA